MYWNYWLNHWQTYSFSLFANAIAFICDDEAISLDSATLTFANKDAATQTLTATTTPNDATVDWLTSDAKVATVNTSGVVDPQGKGTCIISAVNGDSVASCVVTVSA
jgi:alpha-amylase